MRPFTFVRAGDVATALDEVTRPGEAKFIAGGTPIAVYRGARGEAWRIFRVGTFYTIAPLDNRDMPRGKLDVVLALRALKGAGIITGKEWFNGIAFGIEPTFSGGRTQFTIRKLRVTYDGAASGPRS